MSSSLCQTLGIKLPLIQAPMAGVQGHALAAAVCNAGGLGSIPAAMLSLDVLEQELTQLSRLTSSPYNVNFFVHHTPQVNPLKQNAWQDLLSSYYEEYGIDVSTTEVLAARAPFSHQAADVLEAFKPEVVSFHFGLPAPDLLARVKSWGSFVMSSATTVAEGLYLQEHGVDAVIAQGLEAGGHRGVFLTQDPVKAIAEQIGTFALLPQLVSALSIPVIAAGGIANAQGVQAAFQLGADAVQCGTVFLLCDEAHTSAVHKSALQSAQATQTALTNIFTGRPARGIVNRIMQELGPINIDAPEFPLATSALTPLRQAAEAQGRGDFSPLWAGQNVTGCLTVPAAHMVQHLFNNLV